MLPLIHALMEKPGKEKIYNISMLSLSSLIIIISINSRCDTLFGYLQSENFDLGNHH